MDKAKARAEGRRIRHLLENAGLSYAEIARRLGVTQSHVMHVAAGRRDSGRVRKAIIEALGRDPWAEESKESAA